jgi:hypothetical protein
MTDKEKRMPNSTKKTIKRASRSCRINLRLLQSSQNHESGGQKSTQSVTKGIRLIFSTHIGQYKAPNQTIFILHQHHHFFQPLSIAA